MLSIRCLSVCLSVCPVCLPVTLVHCGQTVGRIQMKLGKQVGLGPGHTVLDGKPAHPPSKGQRPQFSTNIRCGQMAGWIKMPYGREVDLGPMDNVLDGDPAPTPQGGRPPAIFGQSVLWLNGWMDEDGTWHGRGPRSRPHCARWDSAPLSKKGAVPPHFWPFYCGQTAGSIAIPLGMEVGLSPGDFVLVGNPQFSAHVYCSQTAAWIKMPLGTEVGLGLPDIVLDGEPAPPPLKGHSPSPSIFGQCLLWPNGWMD